MSTKPHVAAMVLAIVAFLTSCGGPVNDHPASSTHGAADVSFVHNMIPHHQQAVVLAAMVPAHTGNPALRSIATQIGADQQAEIRTLGGLLTSWGVAAGPDAMPPSDHGGMAMLGMVDQTTMDRLASLYDGPFDTLWVTSMIGHHQGAIAMAQREIAHGQSADAIHVAELIITAQQREIAMMTHLISASQ
ncbi:MAG: hypothetical protein QOJ80_5758 [Mycobacterium sp.]|jgi:uncharacterized protein (DUF305 family)|nr:hypothetical protein [Mycobacterium sp.]